MALIGQLQISTKRRWLGKAKAYHSSDVLGPRQVSEVHRLKVDTEKMLLVMTGDEDPGTSSHQAEIIPILMDM